MALLGLDVSRHQGTINWTQVRSIGTVFAFCKATDGTSYAYTGYFHQQLPLIRAAGLIPGAYHWLQAGQDPVAQARYFVNTIGDVNGLLCALDVEEGSVHEARAFAQEFARLTGGHPLFLYTGRWYWVSTIGNPFGADIGPLWHSEYETTDAEIADGPELDNYGGWSGATMWQYTSSGSVPGINGSCDRNLFYGTHAELLAFAGAYAPVPPPQDDYDMDYVITIEGQHPHLKTDTDLIPLTNDELAGYRVGQIKEIPLSQAGFAKVEASTKHASAQRDRLIALLEQISVTQSAGVDPEVIEAEVREVFADAGQE